MNKNIPDVGNALQGVIKMNGEDLLHGDTSGLFHIMYVVSVTGALDYLEVWSSTLRGYWDLTCRYWMSAVGGHVAGVRFEPGYESEGLARNIEFVMQHQGVFLPIPTLIPTGLLQVQLPLEEHEKALAVASLAEALERT